MRQAVAAQQQAVSSQERADACREAEAERLREVQVEVARLLSGASAPATAGGSTATQTKTVKAPP